MSPSPQNIRHVLLHDWDPHNVIANDAAHASYDGYLAPLQSMIDAGATEDAIVAWLHEREQETMCFPSLGTRRLRKVAAKLLALREGPSVE